MREVGRGDLERPRFVRTNAAEQLSAPRVLGFLSRPSGSSPPGSSPPLQLASPQATLPGPLPCPGPLLLPRACAGTPSPSFYFQHHCRCL